MSSFQLIVINEPDLQPKWPSRLQELSGQDRSQSKHPGRVEILQTNLRTAETERTCCNGNKSVGMPAIHNKYKRITDPKVRDPIGSLINAVAIQPRKFYFWSELSSPDPKLRTTMTN